MKTHNVGIRFDPEMLAKLDRRAAKLGMDRSAYILACVRNELLTGDPTGLRIVAEDDKKGNGK